MNFDELYKSVKNMTAEQKSALMWALFYDACEKYMAVEHKDPLTNIPQPKFGVTGGEI